MTLHRHARKKPHSKRYCCAGPTADAQPVAAPPERESAIQAKILAYLERRGDCHAWRNNSGSYSPRPGQFLRYGATGSPDILVIHAPSGRFVGIEVKTAAGKLSPAQERWREETLRHGGQYVTARSVEDVERALGPVEVKLPRVQRVYPGAT